MSDTVIKVENLWKEYRLGTISHHSMAMDLQSWWSRLRCKEDPNSRIDSPLKYESSNLKPVSAPDRFWALKDVSFEVKRGEVLGIIGRNGAGKSTLLKILSNVTTPTKGQVTYKGRIASLLEVGTGFHPELTGRENVFLNGAIFGMSVAEIRQKFDEIVAFAELEKFIDTPVKRYSSGMYVRLAFAVAAHLDPEILIVDEVLAVGDAQFQKKCLGKMGEVSSCKGRTIVIVSHNMAVINTLCDRGILIDKGQISIDGSAPVAVNAYLENGDFGTSEIVWDKLENAPGNDIVRLKSVRISQEGREANSSDFDISQEITVEISYQNLVEGTELYAALWLKDAAGIEILSSTNAKYINLLNDEWYGKPHPLGVFRSRCTFPANFLNERTYSITPIVGIAPCNTQILESDIVSFTGVDLGDMRTEYLGGWLGVIRPKLPWSTVCEP